MKKREDILKESLKQYIDSMQGSKLISEDKLNEIIDKEMKSYESINDNVLETKSKYNTERVYCRNLVLKNLLPILISSAIALTTMGVCYSCRNSIGQEYDNYYKKESKISVEYIDNFDFEVKELSPSTDWVDSGYYMNAEIVDEEEPTKVVVYSCRLVDYRGEEYFKTLKEKKDISLTVKDYINKSIISSVSVVADVDTEDDYIKIIHVKETDKKTDYSKEKKDGYKMPKKYWARIAGAIVGGIGAIASASMFGYDIYWEEFNLSDIYDARSEYKQAKSKRKQFKR